MTLEGIGQRLDPSMPSELISCLVVKSIPNNVSLPKIKFERLQYQLCSLQKFLSFITVCKNSPEIGFFPLNPAPRFCSPYISITVGAKWAIKETHSVALSHGESVVLHCSRAQCRPRNVNALHRTFQRAPGALGQTSP